MKYLLFLSLLASCGQSNVNRTHTNYRVNSDNAPLELITIDGCQYLYGAWGNATVLTHKGNCNNPIHSEHLRQ